MRYTKASTAQETTVTLFAAKSLNTVMEELIVAYQEKHPNVKIVGEAMTAQVH